LILNKKLCENKNFISKKNAYLNIGWTLGNTQTFLEKYSFIPVQQLDKLSEVWGKIQGNRRKIAGVKIQGKQIIP